MKLVGKILMVIGVILMVGGLINIITFFYSEGMPALMGRGIRYTLSYTFFVLVIGFIPFVIGLVIYRIDKKKSILAHQEFND